MSKKIRLAKELVRIAKVIMDDIDDVDENISETGYPEIDEWIKENNGVFNEDTCKYDFPGNIHVPDFLIENGRLLIEFGKVGGYFDCSKIGLKSLDGCPQFVKGYFSCSDNKLTSLNGCPQFVEGDFKCSENNLTSLKDCPQSVGGNFDCSFNELTSLSGGPQSVGGYFDCSWNNLTSLKNYPRNIGGYFDCSHNKLNDSSNGLVDDLIDQNCNKNIELFIRHNKGTYNGESWDFNGNIKVPEFLVKNGKLKIKFGEVGGYFICSENNLTSLSGCPQSVGRDFYCSYNSLTSLSGCPQSVGGDFDCSENKLTSFKDCPKSVGGDFYCYNNPLTSLDSLSADIGGELYSDFT